MTTKDMLQILIKKQDEFSKTLRELIEKQDTFAQRQDKFAQRQEEFAQRQDKFAGDQDSFKIELATLRQDMRNGFRQVNDRLDKQGKGLAYLEDDAPTREEYDGLTKRVEKIEKVLSS